MEEDNGEIILVFTMLTERGDAEVKYKPQKAAEFLVRTCHDCLVATRQHFPDKLCDLISRRSAQASIQLLLIHSFEEFADPVRQLPMLAFGHLTSSMNAIMDECNAEENGSRRKRPKVFKYVDKILNRFESRRLRIISDLKSKQGSRKPPPYLFAVIYERLLPLWKDAKSRYKRNNDSERWREIIQAAYAEEELPADLIDRLDDKQEHTDAYDSMPSAIALEHAARVCGYKPNEYKTRSLQEFLAEGRKWIAEHSPEEVETELGGFRAQLEASLEAMEEISELLSTAESESETGAVIKQ